MNITFEQAVREVSFFMESVELNPNNVDHVKRIIDYFGETSHEIFQEASEQIAALAAAGVISGEMA